MTVANTDSAVSHDRFAELLANHPYLPVGTDVEVTRWEGCDEPWGDPAYITATAPGRELFDAVCDLTADSPDSLAAYVATQLLNG